MMFRRLLHKLRLLYWRVRRGEEVAQALCFFDDPDAPWNRKAKTP